MNRDQGRLNLNIGVDNSSLRAGATEARNLLRGIGQTATQEGASIDAAFKKVGQSIAGYFAVEKLKEFSGQVAKVRGEFQQLEVAFETMLQSKSKANELMEQLIHTAAVTPFGMSDVANGAKQLLAYGLEADRVNEMLVRLGDIAAGLSIPLNDLAYLYGTTMVQGRLYTADLNQFLGRGIPLTDELAKQFGVAKSQVKTLVEEGKVGFPEVEKAIIAMTDQGGKFGGLMAEQSKTITGQISNLEDEIEQMFNTIGKRTEGFMSGSINLTSTIVGNWETIGKIVLACVAAYGTYKAAIIAVAAAHKIAMVWGEVQAFMSLTKNVTSAKDAMLLLNMATKANPIGIVIGVVAAAAAAFGMFRDEVSETAQMTEKYGEKAATAISRLDSLTMTLQGLDANTKTYNTVLGEMNTLLEEYGIKAIKEGDSIDVVNRKRAEAIELIKQEAIARQYANNISQGQSDYQAKITSADSGLRENLSGTWIGDLAGVSSVHKELESKSAEITTVISDYVQNNIEKIAGKTGEEYTKGLRQMYDDIAERMSKIGISKETIEQEFDWRNQGKNSGWKTGWEEYITTVLDARNTLENYSVACKKAKEAEEEAANGAMTYEQRVDAVARRLRGAENDVHGLFRRIKDLISQYSENTIGFSIKIKTEGEIPKWMLEKDTDELARLASWFTSAGNQLANGKTLKVGDKSYTKQELINQGVDYAVAYESKKQAEEKKERDDAANAKENARKAKQAKEKAAREAKQIADQTAERTKAIAKYNKDVVESVRDAESDITGLTLELREEGFDKEMAQLQRNHQKLLDENKKRERDMLEALADNKLNEWLNANPKKTKTEQVEYRASLLDENNPDHLTSADLPSGQQKVLKMYADYASQYEMESKKRLYKGLLDKYQSFEEQRKAINKQYDDDRTAITNSTDASIIANKESLLAELERKRKDSLKGVNDAEVAMMQKSSKFIISIFEDTANKSTSEIESLIDKTRELLNYLKDTSDAEITAKFGFSADELKALKASPDQIKAITEQLKKLQEIANKSNPFKALTKAIKNVFNNGSDANKNSNEALIKDIGEAAADVADIVGGLAGQLSDMFDAMGNQTASEAASAVQDVMSSVSNIGKGFAQGGIIGGIAAAAGEAIGYVTKAFQAAARHAEALKEIQREQTAQQRAYTLALLEEQLTFKKGDTIFGSLNYAKAKNAVNVMADSYKKLRQEMGKLQQISIKTGHEKTGLFGWGAGRDVFSSILSQYPQLIDANGNFNKTLAESIVATQTFDGEGKEALQHMIDLAGQAESAFEEVKSYLSGIFGDLGNSLSDALVDAFKNGTDAAKAFTTSVSDMLEKLTQQMVFSAFFDSYIQQANERFIAITKNQYWTDEQKFNMYMDTLNTLTNNILSKQDQYNAVLNAYKQKAEEKGLYVFQSNATREATSKGIASASQDSVNELNGRATAIQSHTYSINENTKMLVSVTSGILQGVLEIRDNTNNVPERLSSLERGVNDIRTAMNDIAIKGIRIKS